MNEKVKGVLAATAAVAALGVGGAAIAGAAGGGDKSPQQPAEPATAPSALAENEAGDNDARENENQGPISGSPLDKASAAALEHTGGGQVTGSEVGDEESYYEIEVTRDDGSQVDVQLDRGFNVVGAEDEGSGDE